MNTMNVIAFDIGSEVSSVCVLGANGGIRAEQELPTRISAFKALIKKIPRPRQVVFEEGTQAAWLWSELRGICDDVLVCEPRAHKPLLGVFKSDKNDTRKLAKHALKEPDQRYFSWAWHKYGGQGLHC
jgi:hypothetical protein